ncbi:ASKHA domain-containing protein [Carboxydothermus pertinax]|uniref:Ferredoxin n=1 Tax=Carboxydothermus pertinax TaxID=870242 RepID=A0A1L8CVI5_9THEO|nr:ASKHA domain-containing protein [Carboxydothermus pertinax]GAV22913.1 ferredoxin [Carboxydothermus pertinax]
MKKFSIKIYPENVELQAEENATLKDVFIENGIKFDFPCGGVGKCKKCKVKILKNNGLEEEVLACQTKVESDLVINLQQREQKHHILNEGVNRQIELKPLVRKIYVELPKPTLEDNRPDWTRLKETLGRADLKTKVNLLQELPEKLRESDFKATIVLTEDEVLAVEPGDTTDRLLGMAFDIGTTTVVGYLLDLNTGKELAHVSALNPQTKYGADVISRITFASQEKDGLEKLHQEIINEINNLVAKATEQAGHTPQDIYAITIAGNTTMHHLFLKIPPENLAKAPYVPVVKEPIRADAGELKININPAGKVFVLSNIAGFVGADTVAAALVAEMDQKEKLTLLIDIGTNGEMVLGTGEKLFACSAAAGPAFEGAQIACGMRGAEGAIDHLTIGEELFYSVIGEVEPLGICGSGLLDIVAELLNIGIIDENGRLLPPEKISDPIGQRYRERIIEINGIRAFVVANGPRGEKIYITQKDIRELQLAKGAIAAGIEILLKEYGADVKDIEEVQLAGAFGNYLKPRSACRTGLIPRELEAKIKGIGNAAGAGAKLALLSEKEFQRAVSLGQKIKYIELSARSDFTAIFAHRLRF